MRGLVWVGVLLVVLGIAGLAVRGFTYTTQEKVVDLGPIHATADRQERIPLPPILGGLALAGGIALLIAGARQKT